MIGTLNDLGTFAMETIESIRAQLHQPLCYNLSKCMVNLIEGIEAMNAERDSSNESPEENLSPVLPHELVNCMVPSLQPLLEGRRNSCRNGCWQLKQLRLSKTFKN